MPVSPDSPYSPGSPVSPYSPISLTSPDSSDDEATTLIAKTCFFIAMVRLISFCDYLRRMMAENNLFFGIVPVLILY